MASINPLIALQTQGIDTATPTRNLLGFAQQQQQNEQQREMLDLRKQTLDLERVKTAFEQRDAAEKRRFRNVAVGSMQLQNVLERQGPEGAMQWLQNNAEGNQRIGLPSDDTQEAMEMLQAGKLDELETSLSNNVILGEQLDLISGAPERFEPIVDDQGNPIAQRSTETGKVISDPRAPSDPGVKVDVNVGQDKFTEESSKLRAQRIDTMIETGRRAVATEQNLEQMADLLVDGVQTGAAQPALMAIQGLAEDFGLDVENMAKKAGIENLSNLSGKEEFDRLAKTTIIEGFDKFTGNLNESEVKLGTDAFNNLGKSEEGNILAIASLRAGQTMAKDRALRASQATTPAEARAVEAELFSSDTERFNRLRDEFETDIRERMRAKDEQAAEAGVPQSAIDAGVNTEMWEAMDETDREAFR